MKKTLIMACFIAIGTLAFGQKPSAENQDKMLSNQQTILANQELLIKMYGSDMDMNNEVTKMSYAYGLSLAENLKMQGLEEVNYDAFKKGMIDVMEGGSVEMTTEEAQQFLNEYMGNLMAMKVEKTKAEGKAFLAENANRKEVTQTESGLQYEVMKEGSGAKPTAESTVTVHYHGTLLNGEVFDSSVQRGQPATFGLNQVIKGWTEGVQLMTPGSKYRFYIPSDLAYGDRGAGGSIGPGETLIFEVELLEVK